MQIIALFFGLKFILQYLNYTDFIGIVKSSKADAAVGMQTTFFGASASLCPDWKSKGYELNFMTPFILLYIKCNLKT